MQDPELQLWATVLYTESVRLTVDSKPNESSQQQNTEQPQTQKNRSKKSPVWASGSWTQTTGVNTVSDKKKKYL